ncbi:MAG: ATP-binding cassette domain-containing protein [Clostridiales bacterium]|nr:ATP-binding cassette domain-containing protein [Clostridiales bacterium]
MAHFEIRDLSFSHATARGKESLSHVDLTVEKGEYIVLCGRSGSGKTTLLRHLKTVLAPGGKKSGAVLFDGRPLEDIPVGEQAAKIGFVMQDPDDQIVTDKVWHELAFGLESLGVEPRAMRARVAEMACYFGIQDWFHRDVEYLSGGQKQLLNLASVMAMQPEVLILDEPTSQLDPIAASDFLNTVRKINIELGTTVILTEHRLEDIFPYADRAVVMEGGRIIADDVPGNIGAKLWAQKSEMFSAMPAPVRVFYGADQQGSSPLTVRDGRTWLSRSFPEGAAIKALPDVPLPLPGDPPALSLKEVWFRYEKEGADILRGVNAEVPQGCIYGIVGGNGAGKSTALKAIAGIVKPYRGKVKLFGKPIEKHKAAELFHGGLAMLPQDPKSLFAAKTVREELLEMCKDEAKIAAAAENCDILTILESHPYDLSGGEQQRAALAKVLLTEPKLLLLDEPTKGIDGFFKEKLAEILKKLTAAGITVIMVSHDVEFCAKHADLVSMFFDGQILTTDTPRHFFGGNSFYTTAANRMSRHVFSMAVTAEDVVALYRSNREQAQK